MQASEKPEGDKYGFTHFAHKLMSSKGLNPLPSDARRRADRFALEVCTFDLQHTFPILTDDLDEDRSVLDQMLCERHNVFLA